MGRGVGSLSGVALECADPAALAEFYSGLTGWPVVFADSDGYSVGQSPDADLHLSFQRSPGHQPPTWPDPASSMQRGAVEDSAHVGLEHGSAPFQRGLSTRQAT